MQLVSRGQQHSDAHKAAFRPKQVLLGFETLVELMNSPQRVTELALLAEALTLPMPLGDPPRGRASLGNQKRLASLLYPALRQLEPGWQQEGALEGLRRITWSCLLRVREIGSVPLRVGLNLPIGEDANVALQQAGGVPLQEAEGASLAAEACWALSQLSPLCHGSNKEAVALALEVSRPLPLSPPPLAQHLSSSCPWA